LDPLELGTIAAIVLVLFLWGPQKIPDLARTVAQARREFDNATKEFQKFSKGIQDGTSPLLSPSKALASVVTATPQAPAVKSALPQGVPPPAPAPKSGDVLLIEAARKLGISTAGKTREQIQQDIIELAQRAGPAAEPGKGQETGTSSP